MERKRLGIMGGSFDPIHNGHLQIAEQLQQLMQLEKVLFVPAYDAPHKKGAAVASAEDRWAMTKLALAGKPSLVPSALELERKGVSYTYDTLVALKEQYGSSYDLYFILGADSALELHTWHKPLEILQLCTVVAASRPGFVVPQGLLEKNLGVAAAKAIIWVQDLELGISSTSIRQLVAAGKSIEHLVPAAVAEYIRQKDLYR